MPDYGSVDLGHALSTRADRFEALAGPTLAILNQLEAAGLAHGDLKATNLLVSDDSRVALIDYDALGYGTSRGDKARFLANWDQQPELKARWQKRMNEAGL